MRETYPILTGDIFVVGCTFSRADMPEQVYYLAYCLKADIDGRPVDCRLVGQRRAQAFKPMRADAYAIPAKKQPAAKFLADNITSFGVNNWHSTADIIAALEP